MKVEVLGPWFAAPPVGESGACNSFLVEGESGSCILLDCGPGTVARLQERALTQRVGAIILSHTHPDHVVDLIQYANLRGVWRNLGLPVKPERPKLFAPHDDGKTTLTALESVWRKPEAGRNPFSHEFDFIEYTGEETLELGGISVSFERTSHARPCYAMRLTDAVSTVVYTADTGYSESVVAHARNADLMLCEATLLDADPRWTEKHGHLTGEMAGRMAEEAGAGRLVLTHLGPNPDINDKNLERAGAACGVPVELAKAGAVYEP